MKYGIEVRPITVGNRGRGDEREYYGVFFADGFMIGGRTYEDGAEDFAAQVIRSIDIIMMSEKYEVIERKTRT